MKDCFYEKGLRFECQGCNYCCSGEPGYVFLSEDDIQSMSSFLGLDRQSFIDTYCRLIDMGSFKMVSLLEKDNYDCIFLCQKGCKVYEARPQQCRTYPFWEGIVENKQSWESESRSCPGMNKGRLHTKSEIEKAISSRISNNPLIIM